MELKNLSTTELEKLIDNAQKEINERRKQNKQKLFTQFETLFNELYANGIELKCSKSNFMDYSDYIAKIGFDGNNILLYIETDDDKEEEDYY